MRRALPLLTALAALLAAGPVAFARGMPGCRMAMRALAARGHRCCPPAPAGYAPANDCCRLSAPAPAPGPAPDVSRPPLAAPPPTLAFVVHRPALRAAARSPAHSRPRPPPALGSALPIRI